MTKWVRNAALDDLELPDVAVMEEMALAMAQSTIQGAMDESRITRADLAAKMERPRSFVSRMLKGDHNLTIKTFARALAGCGYELQFSYVPAQASTIPSVFSDTGTLFDEGDSTLTPPVSAANNSGASSEAGQLGLAA